MESKKLSTIFLKLLSVIIDNYSISGSTLVLMSGDCLFNGIVIDVVVVWNYSGYFFFLPPLFGLDCMHKIFLINKTL